MNEHRVDIAVGDGRVGAANAAQRRSRAARSIMGSISASSATAGSPR